MEGIPNQLSHERVDELRQIVSKLLTLESDEELEHAIERMESFKKYLLATYENAQDHATYHVLAWGTPFPGMELIYEDFPDDDSVEKFLTQLASEYL